MSQKDEAGKIVALAERLNEMAAAIGAQAVWKVTGAPDDWKVDATESHKYDGYEIGYRDGKYEIRYIERTEANDQMTIASLDDLTYETALALVQMVTWTAWWRRADTVPSFKDYRHQTFAAELKLLSRLSPEWRERREREQAAELKKRPFYDRLSGLEQLQLSEFYYLSDSVNRIMGRNP